MIKINEAARILGFGEEPTDAGKAEARIVMKYFGITGTLEVIPAGTFGKPAKLYDSERVQALADMRNSKGF
jgi:hypothetical protein